MLIIKVTLQSKDTESFQVDIQTVMYLEKKKRLSNSIWKCFLVLLYTIFGGTKILLSEFN